MNLSLPITLALDPALSSQLERLITVMSALADAIAAANTAADAAILRVQTDLANLQTEVTALQAQVASGTFSPDDVTNLAALEAKLAALDPQNPAVLPPAPSPTPTPSS